MFILPGALKSSADDFNLGSVTFLFSVSTKALVKERSTLSRVANESLKE